MAIKLLSRTIKFSKFRENSKKYKIIFLIFEKRNICEITLGRWAYLHNLHVHILKNGWVLPSWMPKKATYYAIYEDFGDFRVSNSDQFWSFKKCSRVIFAFLTKIWHNNMYHITATQNFKIWPFWPQMTLTWHKVTKGLGGYLKYARHDPCRSIGFISLWYGCFSRRSEQWQTLKNLTFDRPVTSSVTFR